MPDANPGPAEGGDAFVAFLSAHAHDLDETLLSAYVGHGDPELERYLYGPLAAFTSNAGKRVRPLVCLLACQAVGGDPARARTTAAAIERFQSAALIHDDIADEGQLRRGKPCMHLTEGVGIATNCGDLALSEVFGTVAADAALDASTRLAVLDELFSMTRRTIEGQALDLGWARDERWDVTVDDYLRMATLKTAHYSAATPLAVGALIGGASQEQVEALRSFGLDAGLAFQLVDDTLNLFGDEAEQGKDYRSDITEGKRTLLVTYSLAHVDATKRDELVRLLSSHVTDACGLDACARIMQGCGAEAFARHRARELSQRAVSHLDGIDLTDDARHTLASMADFFVARRG
jgi:geranylgeranyl diphosphate synthase type I